ncbi:WD repeat-containing protein 26 [Chlorella vulgaris]
MAPPHPLAVCNGSSGPQQTLGSRGLVNRTEYIRVLEQALRALGYDSVAEALEHASGIVQQPQQAAAFRQAVLFGSYDEALQLLPSVAADDGVMDRARFLLLRQKYLEGVQQGRTAEALQVLRQQLQPLRVQQQVLHSLAALLLQSGTGSGAMAGVSAAQLEQGRAVLLDELQESLMPSLLIPERRLEELVEQALVTQLERSRYHNSLHTRLSLFSDYQAGAEQLPTQPNQVLEDHSSEVWCISFSQDGCWAASASKDGSALLWAVTAGERLENPRVLLRQPVPCQLVAFSPDSQLVLTASLDSVVRLHDVQSSKLLRSFPQGREAGVVAISWFPCSRQFLVATHKLLAVYGTQQAGAAPQRRLPSCHAFVYDAVVLGGCIISVGQDRQVAFSRLSDQRVEHILESGTVTSLHLSPCHRFLTTNLASNCVHLWQLPPGLGGQALAGDGAAANGHAAGSSDTLVQQCQGLAAGSSDPFDELPSAPLHEYRMADARPGRYVLRSCVGGATSGFVACGAEDCLLRIWSRVSGEQLACLSGPAGCVNAVAWHPRNPSLIACASDDSTIRTWLAPAAQRGRLG